MASSPYSILTGTFTTPSTNYTAPTLVAGSTLSVTAANLTATVANQTKVYGADDPSLAGVGVTLGGLVNRTVTTWNGSITIAGSLQRQLQQDLHDTKVGAPAPPRDWSHLLMLAGLIAVFLCAVGAILLRRRARRAPMPAG